MWLSRNKQIMIATELKLEDFVYIVRSKSTINENRIYFNNNNSLSLAVGLAVVAVETKKAYYQIKEQKLDHRCTY